MSKVKKGSDWRQSPGNNDQHYSGTIQPINLIMDQKLGFAEGNVVKYITRWRAKGGVEDLQKVIWYTSVLLASESTIEDLEQAIRTIQGFIKGKREGDWLNE